jgi:tRNA(Ile2) C34 agmatinyltransferase TiaS
MFGMSISNGWKGSIAIAPRCGNTGQIAIDKPCVQGLILHVDSFRIVRYVSRNMSQECPKCHYVRGATDAAPDYECPRCGIVYAKAGAARAQARSGSNVGPTRPVGRRMEPPQEIAREGITVLPRSDGGSPCVLHVLPNLR